MPDASSNQLYSSEPSVGRSVAPGTVGVRAGEGLCASGQDLFRGGRDGVVEGVRLFTKQNASVSKSKPGTYTF